MNLLKMIGCGFLGALLFHLLQTRFAPVVQADAYSVMSATGFNLVDKQGRLRAQIGFAKEGPPGLWIMDEKGTARIAMGLYPDGTSHIGLQDKEGRMIQLLRSIGPGESPLLIFKNQGADKMILGLNAGARAPFLLTYDKDRKLHFGTYDGP